MKFSSLQQKTSLQTQNQRQKKQPIPNFVETSLSFECPVLDMSRDVGDPAFTSNIAKIVYIKPKPKPKPVCFPVQSLYLLVSLGEHVLSIILVLVLVNFLFVLTSMSSLVTQSQKGYKCYSPSLGCHLVSTKATLLESIPFLGCTLESEYISVFLPPSLVSVTYTQCCKNRE